MVVSSVKSLSTGSSLKNFFSSEHHRRQLTSPNSIKLHSTFLPSLFKVNVALPKKNMSFLKQLLKITCYIEKKEFILSLDSENPVLSSNIKSIRSGEFKHIDSPKQHVGGDPRVYSASYEEHEKRAWSVDFSRSEPSMLVSSSDDFKVHCSLSFLIGQNLVHKTLENC
uniref:Uncharacterized protein n=1 Tax=Cucumis melo TaxID=3656 RepID=A0A9I9E770_CUCME